MLRSGKVIRRPNMSNAVNAATTGVVNETIPPSQTNGEDGTNTNVPVELTPTELLNRMGEMIDARIQAIRNELINSIQTTMPYVAPLPVTSRNHPKISATLPPY